MDSAFWIGIGTGAFLSFVASVVANVYSDAIKSTLQNRQKFRLDKKQAKELDLYNFLYCLRERDPNAHVELLGRQTEILHIGTYAVHILLLGVLVSAMVVYARHFFASQLPHFVFNIGFALIFLNILAALFLYLYGHSRYVRLRSDIRKLLDFDEYETELIARWGPNAIRER